MFEGSLPRRQIIIFAGIAALIGSILFALYFLLGRPHNEVLFDGLRPADAAAIVAELDKHKLPYSLADKGTTIMVPEKVADSARLAIAGSDLPMKGEVGFELFNKSDMGLTEFAQKINYQRALQGELARTISSLGGIETARVHLSLPQQSIFDRERGQAKAAVTVTAHPGVQVDDDQVAGIQRLVASAVPDLDASAVVVIDSQGDILSGSVPQKLDPAMPQNQALAQYYTDRIRSALHALGRDDEILVLPLSDVLTPSAANGPDLDDPKRTGSVPSADPRRFGLHVVIAPKTALDPQHAQEIVDTVRRAINFDASVGDDVSIGTIPQQLSPPPSTGNARHAPAKERQPVPVAPPPDSHLAAIVSVIGAILAGAALIVWLLARRPLSQRQRDRLIAQLGRLLDEHQGSQANAR